MSPIHDTRRIEVVCNGLPLWHGAQLAVDATLVSPLSRDGRPHPGTETQPGAAVRTAAARRKHRQTYPEFDRGRRCRLVVFGLEVGGRRDGEAASFLRLTARASPCHACCAPPGCTGSLGAAVERPRCCCCAAGAYNHVPRAADACEALCCRTSPGLAQAPRRRSLDQRASAEPRRGLPVVAE